MIKKYFQMISITTLMIFIAVSAYCTDWLYFIENGNGDKHYIDLDSLKRSSQNIVSLRRKIEYKEPVKHSYLISDIEMDCEKVIMRKLSEKAYGPDAAGEDALIMSDWHAINPEGIDESLYELACSLKKKRNEP
jgi:hypothetical protein